MTIENGTLKFTLITDYEKANKEVDKMTKDWVNSVNKIFEDKIAETKTDLLIMDPVNKEQRIIRANVFCLVKVTGQNILNMLEMGANQVGETDGDGKLSEFGGFLHVAGMKYTVDTSYSTPITLDEKENWVKGPSENYRVKDVMIYDKGTGKYLPIDLKKLTLLAEAITSLETPETDTLCFLTACL